MVRFAVHVVSAFAVAVFNLQLPCTANGASDKVSYQVITVAAGEFTQHIPVNELLEVRYLAKKITFKKPFSIGKFEVTNDQWNVCYRAGGCAREAKVLAEEKGNYPVVRVNWHDAFQFANWLSKVTGENYRLPTEQEWIYAAYMGREHIGIENSYDYSNLAEIGKIVKKTNPVGTYKENNWGYADYLGNVWEWTLTCWYASDENMLRDFSIEELNTPAACSTRIVQGENRAHVPDFINDTYNGGCATLKPTANLGFRLVKEIRER